MLNDSLKNELVQRLSFKLGNDLKITGVASVSGGDINECYLINTANGKYFVKLNDADKYPKMFASEAKGLSLLNQHSNFVVPEVQIEFDNGVHSVLVISYLDLANSSSWKEFGRCLAEMHLVTADYFGLDHNNYIGSLPQSNKKHSSWSSFYAEERLYPLFKKAFDSALFTSKDKQKMDALLSDLENRFPIEPPSLLHGDLWSGNAAFVDGKPCIYDPAVYFGHREMDIGMTLLFGGFPEEMYSEYTTIYPLENAWKERVELSQLYPLLVHVLLFGGSYINQVKRILDRS